MTLGARDAARRANIQSNLALQHAISRDAENKRGRTTYAARFILAFGLLAVCVPAKAGETAPNFSGKTVTLYIGYAPGSGNDVIGRLIAAHLGKHIPGNPTIVPQNMPGAGSFIAAGYMYSVAPKDGTAIGLIAQTAATEELLGDPSVRFKTAKFGWIGRISSYNIVTTTWHTSKVKTIADAEKIESTVGATGAGATVYNYPKMMDKVLGTKFKIVVGYDGTNQTALAMERGEVEGVNIGWFTIKTQKQDWLKEKKINILTQFLTERHPDLPDVPTIVEFARNDREAELFRLFANEGELGKAIFGPPDMPPATLAALRKGFDEMMVDPSFIAEADKLQVERAPMSGEKVQQMIEQVSRTSPEVVASARALLK